MKYYTINWKTLKSNENIMKMHGGAIGSDLLNFNEIAKGYPYENQLEYYKINWKPLKFNEHIMEMYGKSKGSDLLKLKGFARGVPLWQSIEIYCKIDWKQ